jgi:uncharacterized membrane protein YeaQ/YmgE (transglycosylase-associated protein family)
LQAENFQHLNQEDFMTPVVFLCNSLMDLNPGAIGALVPVVGAIVLFGVFLPVAVWTSNQKEERLAYYKAETLRRLAEASGEGAKAAIDLLREEERMKRIKQNEGVKLGGLITLGAGVGLAIFLHAVANERSVYLVGLIPGLVGAALLIYVYFMAPPIE